MTTASSNTPAGKLSALRAAMAKAEVDAYLVPHSDEHQGEFVPVHAQRLEWLTGFTGSAGQAIVLADKAAVFIDGRYTLQVRDQVDGALYQYRHMTDEPAHAYLSENLKKGQKVGFDPRLHTPAALARLEESAAKVGASLVPIAGNLVDAVWQDRPKRPMTPVMIYPDKFAGRTHAEKRGLVAKALKEEALDAFFISALDSVAWLFNIRGDDTEFCPLTIAYALQFADGKAILFIDEAKLSPEVKAHLGPDVKIAPYDGLDHELTLMDKSVVAIGLDRDTGTRWANDRFSANHKVKVTADPVAAIKAKKHPMELQGVRDAHVRDGVALTRFLAWLAKEGPKGTLNEITAADKLERFRRENNLCRGLSFATIAGADGNGAIVHYRATPKTAAKIKADTILLVDSGGQYLDGTTDVTRTIAITKATQEQKHRFTLVLKGHIALATTRFVKGTTGSQLDALARHALWQEGLDYDHGTGHGIGTYLGVHEGPHRIGKVGSTVALEVGHVVSNEPGYYKTGEYGIRIESLVVVREAAKPAGSEKQLLEFETITLAPIDLNMVEPSLLNHAEQTWLDGYHMKVRETLSPLVDAETRAWLEQATRSVRA